MNVLSSSFLSKLVSRPVSLQSLPPHLNISSARIEDQSQASLSIRPNETKCQASNAQIPPLNAFSSSIGATVTMSIFDAFEDIIHNFIDPPLRPAVDPRFVLSGNFAPVNELPPTECEVIQGALPSCLDGAYIRNGPNPHYFPRGSYHLFDGDGMLHSLRISQGKATLCSRYVKTYKYTTERSLGSPVVPSFFSSFSSLPACIARGALFAARIIMGHYDPAKGIGNANTSLALSTVYTRLLSLIYHTLYA
ncbi:hypothetical protein V6N13_096383 [Hibiscus sabdariffa]|uniref:Uncharacterized protein n=1 Tax=Hibiscus sabdariffa TaxID=183260 RepID=A0ABR2DFX7_9ROSI